MSSLICITGIDGCGKSTHVKQLQEWLTREHRKTCRSLSVWDIARDQRYQHHPFISDKAAVHRYLGSLHGGPRALFVFHGLLESYDLAIETPSDLLIADGYWFKYAFSEHLNGENLAWLSEVAGRLPKPRLTILLDVEASEAWKRKPAVTPYECGFQSPSEQSFIEYQTKLRNLFLKRAWRDGWKIVYGNRPMEEVFRDIQKITQHEVLAKWM